ncbi:MAG: hypothetical protein DRJ09_08130 [Bacteroidetes bacterium]|nr:MAG: hypothetical protein DRJ09_08130 [Bacteroidota bacterium]
MINDSAFRNYLLNGKTNNLSNINIYYSEWTQTIISGNNHKPNELPTKTAITFTIVPTICTQN